MPSSTGYVRCPNCNEKEISEEDITANILSTHTTEVVIETVAECPECESVSEGTSTTALRLE